MTKSWYADPGANFSLPGFCPSNVSVHKADFNGDGRMDLMCHDSSNIIFYYGSDTGYSDIGGPEIPSGVGTPEHLSMSETLTAIHAATCSVTTRMGACGSLSPTMRV